MFKISRTRQPVYLHDLLQVYTPPRNLRSSAQGLISVARTRMVLAARAFTHSATCIWNSLSVFIRGVETISCFRRNLKTFLFTDAFTD